MGRDILMIALGAAAPAIVTVLVLIINRGTGLSRRVAEMAREHEAALQEVDRRLTKRADRVDRVLPTMARGVWAVLKFHVQEQNGARDPDIEKAYDELTKVTTDGIVSQKEKE